MRDNTAVHMGWVGSHRSKRKAKSSRRNGFHGGRPMGVKDSKPRIRKLRTQTIDS